MEFSADLGRWISPLERKYLLEVKRAAQRGELMGESVAKLKQVLEARGWARRDIGGIEKTELVLKVLPYLDPTNATVDDEPFPLGSNCMIQFVLRAILLVAALAFGHTVLGASPPANAALLATEALVLIARNLRIRSRKRDKLRKMR